MKSTGKPERYRQIMNDWNCDGSCTVTSVLIQDLEDFYCLIFAAQNVHTLERVTDVASMFKIPTSYPQIQ
jgi:hypothetical protein